MTNKALTCTFNENSRRAKLSGVQLMHWDRNGGLHQVMRVSERPQLGNSQKKDAKSSKQQRLCGRAVGSARDPLLMISILPHN